MVRENSRGRRRERRCSFKRPGIRDLGRVEIDVDDEGGRDMRATIGDERSFAAHIWLDVASWIGQEDTN